MARKKREEPDQKPGLSAAGLRAKGRVGYRTRAAIVLAKVDPFKPDFAEEVAGAIEGVDEANLVMTQEGLQERLATQIQALDHSFYTLLMLSNSNHEDEKKLRLLEAALKCQKQSARTIALLSELRNPKRTQFIKHYVDKQLNQLKLEQQQALEEGHNAPMDFGSTPAASGTDQDLAAVEVSHRPQN